MPSRTYPTLHQTPLTICSAALTLLGGQSIASFDEGTAGSAIANTFYDVTFTTMLTERPWRFAQKVEALTPLATKPTDTSYKYAYQIPSDSLYILKVNNGSKAFSIYKDTIWSNDSTMVIEYTTRVDEELLPKYFVRALEYHLASLFAIPLTSDQNLAVTYGKLYDRQLLTARNADSTQVPTTAFGSSAYIATRVSG